MYNSIGGVHLSHLLKNVPRYMSDINGGMSPRVGGEENSGKVFTKVCDIFGELNVVIIYYQIW